MTRVSQLTIEPIVGLEVHIQLETTTKMWCGCPAKFGAPPNTHVCPTCLGLPGALPVANERAIELTILMGLALNCQIAETTRWDRKGYYYPDLPKNYQISQYDLPLCRDGYIELKSDHKIHKIRINRAHLEEDAGKNVHDLGDCTAVDLNRAGTPLLEIVTEPDLASADEAREFAVQLQRLVRYLGVSEANMQKGQMRFEPNINLRITKDGRQYLTPIVEVKNLNSFRALHGAIAHEIERQLREWQETGNVARVGNKSNRGWDDAREVTTPQREKEEAHDYRYFPDPDLVRYSPDQALIAQMREHMPELPIMRTERIISEYKLPARDAPVLVDCRASADLLDQAAEVGGDKVTLGKHFLGFWSRHAHEMDTTIAGLGIPATRMAELANLVRDGKVNATAAGRIAETMVHRADELITLRDQGAPAGKAIPRPNCENSVITYEPIDAPELAPERLAEELGLLQSSDEVRIAEWIDQVLAANEQAVRDAVSNPKKLQAARGFLTGQVMKLSGGQADPQIAGRLLAEKLAEIAQAG